MKKTRQPGRHSYVKDVTGASLAGPGDPSRLSRTQRSPGQKAAEQGVIIKALDGAVVTDDGRDILITIQRAEGKPSTLVCPTALAPNLVILLAQSMATAQRRRDASAGRQVMVAQALQLKQVGGKLLAILRISGGAELSFLLPDGAERELLAALEPARRRLASPASQSANG